MSQQQQGNSAAMHPPPPPQSLDAVLNENSMPWSGVMSPGKYLNIVYSLYTC